MKTLIVVPARYGSSRFPGKPLAEIAGRSMISRVALRAGAAAKALGDAAYAVATDDARIADHCKALGLNVVITATGLASGSDRALAAARALGADPEFIVNLQGDAPFTPVDYITRIVAALETTNADAATPVIRLDWAALGALREAKRATPFSGTTCVFDAQGKALWFSKTIIPAIRDEASLRKTSPLSPVWRHVGLYGFRRAALERFTKLPESPLEKIEGLEQLRLLENGMTVQCVAVDAPKISTAGIDTKEDLARVEALIATNGDPDAEFFTK
ncbi:MAG: 3-deoxy-manno-octulosonate cytidylyltransferase [Parvularculaceae bacterium]